MLVLSGPAGSGKSTLVARVLAMPDLNVRRSVSATTRPPRQGEMDGVHYHFWTRAKFEREATEGNFLEWADVYGQLYGTLKTEVDPYLARGVSVLLVIDVQGARQVRRLRPDCVLVFLRASSLEEYERRIRSRQSETEETLERRLAAAKEELAAVHEYDYQVINDNLDDAVQAFRRILLLCGGNPT